MGTKPVGYSTAGVCWRDVWAWAEDLRDEYRYHTVVQVTPPLAHQRTVAYVLVVRCTRLGGNTSADHVITRQLTVGKAANTAPEAVALQLVSAIYQSVDRERYEAERAAEAQGLLL